MRNIRYLIIVISLLILTSPKSNSLEIAEDEIKKVKKVKFQNYEKLFESVSVKYLKSIGQEISKISSLGKINTYKLYSIVRILPKENLLGADIFFISKESKIKHINAIRYIIAGYLSEKYGYSYKDALTISIFVTYYNAIYRGNITYFKSKYVPELFLFTSSNIGISTKYYEWPGKTELVIPTKISFGKEKPKLGEVSSKDVIDEIREKENFGIKERKEILEIRKKEAKEEKRKIEEKEREIQEKKKEIEEKKKDIEKREEDIRKTENQEELKAIEKQKEKIYKEEEKLKDEEEKIKQLKEEIEKEEQSIKSEEEEIKEDEMKTLEEKKTKDKEEILTRTEEKTKSREAGDKTVFGNRMYYLRKQDFEPEGHYNNKMYLIDLETRKIIKESKFNKICGAKYYVFGEGVVVIGYKESHKYDHFLVLLDKDNIEPKITGKDNIFWRSFIEFKDNFLYAITIVNGKYYLGKFNTNLENVSISDVEVHPDTFLTFYQGKIFINDKNKNIVILDENTLKKVDNIKF